MLLERRTTRLLSKPTRGTTNSRKEKNYVDELFDGIEIDGNDETESDIESTTIKLEHPRSASFSCFNHCAA